MRRCSAVSARCLCATRFASLLCAPTRATRLAAKPTPPSPDSTAPSNDASVPKADPFDPESIAAEFKLDAKAAEQMRIAQEIGPDAFEENTAILRQLAMRGLRAFLIAAVGLGAFAVVRRRKKRQDDEDSASSGSDTNAEEDPTQRYLEEMRGLGFDVDTLEDELAAEKGAKKNKAGRAIA